MVRIRQGIEKAQLQTQPSTSLSSVAQKLGVGPPVSVLKLGKRLKPETADWDTGNISSGDDKLVTARAHLSFSSTGYWRFSGEVKDGGDGATFGLIATPKFVDGSGKTMLFGEADELSDDETASFSKEGRDLWIARNWDAVRTQGFKWQLSASTSVGFGEILLGVVFPVVGIGLVVFGASECNEQGSWTVENHPDGSRTATCNFK